MAQQLRCVNISIGFAKSAQRNEFESSNIVNFAISMPNRNQWQHYICFDSSVRFGSDCFSSIIVELQRHKIDSRFSEPLSLKQAGSDNKYWRQFILKITIFRIIGILFRTNLLNNLPNKAEYCKQVSNISSIKRILLSGGHLSTCFTGFSREMLAICGRKKPC